VEALLVFYGSGEGKVGEVKEARRKSLQDPLLLALKIGVKATSVYERDNSSYVRI
jgi:hypothetical protein